MKRRTLLLSTAGLVSVSGCAALEGFRSGDSGNGDGDGNGTARTGDGEWLDERGTMEIVIDGEAVDLTADRFQAEHADDHALAFHFHEGSENWYMEGQERVTFAEAVGHIPGFEYADEEGAHVVTFEGTVYDGGDETTSLTFAVDGETLDPREYELSDGDHLELEITTDG